MKTESLAYAICNLVLGSERRTTEFPSWSLEVPTTYFGYLGLWDCSPFLHRHGNVDQWDSGIAVYSTDMQTNKQLFRIIQAQPTSSKVRVNNSAKCTTSASGIRSSSLSRDTSNKFSSPAKTRRRASSCSSGCQHTR